MFDHAQSPRLGQRVATDNTAVRMFSGQELPESPWHGMMIYRTDTQELQVYDSTAALGVGGWIDVVGGQMGQVTFVGDAIPVANKVGDQWFDTSVDPRQLYIALSEGADAIAPGEWAVVGDTAALEQRIDEVEQIAVLRPKVTFATSEPTAEEGRPLQIGDVWYDINDGHRQYKYTADGWVTFDVTLADFSITARKFQVSTHLIY